MQRITSKENKLIKKISKLSTKKYRDLQGEFIVEGIKMVKEAILENAKIKNIVISEDFNSDISNLENYDLAMVPQKIFSLISNVSTPQGILAVAEKQTKNKINFDDDIVLVLDDVQDPGNVGTILRIADSIGLKQIIASNKTADCYNPKVIRSTMGAIFRVQIIESEDLKQTLEELKSHDFKTVVTTPSTQKNIYDINYIKKAIIVGNEANGVSQDIMDISDEKVKIPMPGKAESLNVSVATGIVLYEYVRQKR